MEKRDRLIRAEWKESRNTNENKQKETANNNIRKTIRTSQQQKKTARNENRERKDPGLERSKAENVEEMETK